MKGDKKLIDKLNYLLEGELTAINQYMLHAEMCEDWGYTKLHENFEKRAITEMRHAEKLMGRILFLGGKPIVEKVGSELACLSPADGLAADLGAGVVLLTCSLMGLPASTTHAKVSAICGAGQNTDKHVARQMARAWVLTFPACGAMAFLLTKVMMG